MLKDITLGQFFPGNSLLHKADPRMKIILTVIYIVFVFLADTSAAYLAAIAFTVILIAISRIKLRVIIKGMKPLLFIMLFTAFFNIFWTKGEADELLVSWRFIQIYPEGLYGAAFMIIRIFTLGFIFQIP